MRNVRNFYASPHHRIDRIVGLRLLSFCCEPKNLLRTHRVAHMVMCQIPITHRLANTHKTRRFFRLDEFLSSEIRWKFGSRKLLLLPLFLVLSDSVGAESPKWCGHNSLINIYYYFSIVQIMHVAHCIGGLVSVVGIRAASRLPRHQFAVPARNMHPKWFLL